MRTGPLAVVAILAAAGCAKSPDQIAAVTIDDRTYQGLSCSQLSTEKLRNAQLLQALSADQRSAQSGDALGVFLLGLPISSMSGADKETEIAVTKGKLDAIERARSIKRCPNSTRASIAASVSSNATQEGKRGTTQSTQTGDSGMRPLTETEYKRLTKSHKGRRLIRSNDLEVGTMIDPVLLAGIL